MLSLLSHIHKNNSKSYDVVGVDVGLRVPLELIGSDLQEELLPGSPMGMVQVPAGSGLPF